MNYGFRIVGDTSQDRRLIDFAAAYRAYAACEARAQWDLEAYLSQYMYGDDFRDLLQSTGSVKGFDGAVYSPWLMFDIDRADLDAALRDVRRLALWLTERYKFDDDALLLFFSGGKGFHVGLPTALWTPEPSATFNRVCRRLAERIAEVIGITIDTGVYDKVRPFRAPNSRHPKTGLHKRRLTFDELQGMSLDAIRKLAATPEPFDLPEPPPPCEQAQADWREATDAISSKTKRTTPSEGRPALNRRTIAIISGNVDSAARAVDVFSAAANLAEFGCPPALAHALLTEPALDSGLPPREVHRQIECGLGHTPPIEATPAKANKDITKHLAALWRGDLPGEPPPELRGDAWEHPADRLGVIDPSAITFDFGANVQSGPYAKEGGR